MRWMVDAVLFVRRFWIASTCHWTSLKKTPSLGVVVSGENLARFFFYKLANGAWFMRIEMISCFVIDKNVPDLFSLSGFWTQKLKMCSAFRGCIQCINHAKLILQIANLLVGQTFLQPCIEGFDV